MLIVDCWSAAPDKRPEFDEVLLRLERAHALGQQEEVSSPVKMVATGTATGVMNATSVGGGCCVLQ